MTREALVTNLLPPFYAIRMCGRDCGRNRLEKRANGAVSAPRVGRVGGGGDRGGQQAPVRICPTCPTLHTYMGCTVNT